jgi:hypothetical protein
MRKFTPQPTAYLPAHVTVAAEEGVVHLAEDSDFGKTTMTFTPESARAIAQRLLRAADAAKNGKATG